MLLGTFIGFAVPELAITLSSFELYNVNILIAVLIWVMIIPMMIKVDFKSVKSGLSIG